LTPVHEHPWDLTPAAARALQPDWSAGSRLRALRTDRAGRRLDVGFEQGGALTSAAVAVLRLADLALVDQAIARRPTGIPYVPGLLSFREIPAVLDALAALDASPQLLLCDGHGLAHPRRFGLACHFGWILDVPRFGVAKSRLTGSSRRPRTDAARPRHWSTTTRLSAPRCAAGPASSRHSSRFGHRVALESAIALSLGCVDRYRLPGPLGTRIGWHRNRARRHGATNPADSSRLYDGDGGASGVSAWPRCRPAPVPGDRAPPGASCS
jgi:deoxyribonuclease V